MSGLLSCPFCGKQPRSQWNGCDVPGSEDCGYWGIDCCHALSHADDEETAAAKWNARSESHLRAQLAEAERERDQYRDRLQIDPGGSDKIDELQTACDMLRAQNADMRAALLAAMGGKGDGSVKAKRSWLLNVIEDLEMRDGQCTGVNYLDAILEALARGPCEHCRGSGCVSFEGDAGTCSYCDGSCILPPPPTTISEERSP